MLMIIICHVIGYYAFIPGHVHLGQFFNVGIEIFIKLFLLKFHSSDSDGRISSFNEAFL